MNSTLFKDLHTPRSNRSMDSGLPHDDITPRSDSLSTASSSASPPDQHLVQHPHHRELIQQHRKSTSMDDINGPNTNGVRIVPGGAGAASQPQQTHWKSYSLQRGSTPPVNNSSTDNAIYASTTNTDGTVVIRRLPPAKAGGQQEEEDIYGRCTNMKLTSFVDTSNRDPRIIDLTLGSSPSTSQNGLDQQSAASRTGSPVVMASYQQPHQNFNTLPAQVLEMNSQL